MINCKFEDLDGEFWVPLLRDYEISNMGRIVSKKGKWPRIMRTYRNNSGYQIVHLRINNKRFAYTVHRLVAMIFLKNIDYKKDQVNHHNGKKDNRATSLSWMSSKENGEHAANNKLCSFGRKHYKTSLDELQVRVIRSLKNDLRQYQIANYFNISRASVGVIQQHKVWRHV